jgi:malate dehydrogenase (quinone)
MATERTDVDVVLIGAGIMSGTLGTLLKSLEPRLTLAVFERLAVAAAESSEAWNNAGTGHAAFCELNYTPAAPDGSVSSAKAVKVAEAFEVSRQWWAHLVEAGILREPRGFITQLPHLSFVTGEADVGYLRRRYEALQGSAFFHGMQWSQDPARLGEWMPLMMAGREMQTPMAATRMAIGTDVNFGAITRGLFAWLGAQGGVTVHFHHEVQALDRVGDRWAVRVEDRATGEAQVLRARFVFIGAGGGSLPLLLKSGIPEGRCYGGFPVSGQWLVCHRPEVVARHRAKVYGKAAVGAPPMSVPHLDLRVIQGKEALLFGPYAGFSTRFLKHGSLLDLPRSVRARNTLPMLSAGLDNLTLTRYLIEQVLQSPEDRMTTLRGYVPTAQDQDWTLEVAGQRVQVIKHDEEKGGVLEFGTELVSASDGSLAALLGASPGASTAVSIMLGLLPRCFPEEYRTPAWQAGLRAMIPSFGRGLGGDLSLLGEVRARSAQVLGLGP